jgi:hypothetical protein
MTIHISFLAHLCLTYRGVGFLTKGPLGEEFVDGTVQGLLDCSYRMIVATVFIKALLRVKSGVKVRRSFHSDVLVNSSSEGIMQMEV